jgi:chromosome segregation ATPase
MLASKLEVVHDDQKTADLINLQELQRKLYVGLAKNRKDEPPAARPDLPAALELIAKAAGAVELMDKRAKDIESWALATIRQLRGELVSAEGRSADLEDRARETEQLLRELQFKLNAAEQRAGRAEDRVARADERADRMEEALRDAETRALKCEELLSQAEEELKKAGNRALRAEERVAHAEERASRAEEGASNTEAWLEHVHEAITRNLSGAVGILGKINPEADVAVEMNKKIAALPTAEG